MIFLETETYRMMGVVSLCLYRLSTLDSTGLLLLENQVNLM
jgi:hypothetical protein